MKDTERLRLLYQDSEAFKIGVEVGRKETIEKAIEWLRNHATDYVVTCYDRGELDDEGLLQDFRIAMEE